MHRKGIIVTCGVRKTTFVHRLLSELACRAFQVEMVAERARLRSMEFPMV